MQHQGAQLDIDKLMQRAQTLAGLTDFGDRWFLVPLGRLIEAINAEAGLVDADSMPVERIVHALVDRLRLIQALNDEPAILDERIDVAGVIIGLPRTGSTILQRMLASSPQLTSGYWWEVTLPLPLPGEQPGDPRPRQALAKEMVAGFQDTVRHPIDVSRRLMQAMGLPFTIADEVAIRACLAANERDKRPPHRYTAEEFGLTRAAVATDFSFYTDLYIPAGGTEQRA